MKVLTVKQPYAQLICEGVKDIENRTWKTNFRGRVLIHAGKSKLNPVNILTELQKEIVKKYGLWEKCVFADLEAIIGSVEIVDFVINHHSSWAEKCNPSPDWTDGAAYIQGLFYLYISKSLLTKNLLKNGLSYLKEKDMYGITGLELFEEYLNDNIRKRT